MGEACNHESYGIMNLRAIPLGGLVSIAVLLPNLLVVFWSPWPSQSGGNAEVVSENRLLLVLERVGQLGCFALPFFLQIELRGATEAVALGVMVAALALYYSGWLRYLRYGRKEDILYAPMWRLPLPMAVMPILYFLAASMILHSVWLTASAVILGIGHIPLSQATRARLTGLGKEAISE